eukprot:3022460-Rhodomonas_salina.3
MATAGDTYVTSSISWRKVCVCPSIPTPQSKLHSTHVHRIKAQALYQHSRLSLDRCMQPEQHTDQRSQHTQRRPGRAIT